MATSSLEQLRLEQESRLEAIIDLERIASKYPDLIHEAAKLLSGDSKESSPIGLPSATAAVLGWLRRNGSGSSSQIADDLEGKFATTSDNPKAIVYSTLASLERQNKIAGRREPDSSARVYAIVDKTTPLRSRNQRQIVESYLAEHGPSHRQDIARHVPPNAIRNYLRKDFFDQLEDGRWVIRDEPDNDSFDQKTELDAES